MSTCSVLSNIAPPDIWHTDALARDFETITAAPHPKSPMSQRQIKIPLPSIVHNLPVDCRKFITKIKLACFLRCVWRAEQIVDIFANECDWWLELDQAAIIGPGFMRNILYICHFLIFGSRRLSPCVPEQESLPYFQNTVQGFFALDNLLTRDFFGSKRNVKENNKNILAYNKSYGITRFSSASVLIESHNKYHLQAYLEEHFGITFNSTSTKKNGHSLI